MNMEEVNGKSRDQLALTNILCCFCPLSTETRLPYRNCNVADLRYSQVRNPSGNITAGLSTVLLSEIGMIVRASREFCFGALWQPMSTHHVSLLDSQVAISNRREPSSGSRALDQRSWFE